MYYKECIDSIKLLHAIICKVTLAMPRSCHFLVNISDSKYQKCCVFQGWLLFFH